MALAEATVDIEEGEDKKLDLIEIKTKDNELMFNKKRRTFGAVGNSQADS